MVLFNASGLGEMNVETSGPRPMMRTEAERYFLGMSHLGTCHRSLVPVREAKFMSGTAAFLFSRLLGHENDEEN